MNKPALSGLFFELNSKEYKRALSGLLPFLELNTVDPYKKQRKTGMNHGATGSTHTLNNYEQVGRRIQRLVSDPNVQKVQTIKIARRDDESPAAWEQVIQELEETDGITVERLEEDSVRIGWQKYADL
jgi:hypothetical protein